jgi:capsid protein
VRLRECRVQDGLPVPPQLQGLEADHLDSTRTEELKDGGFILQGVEFDALGRRRAYWLYPTHPGDGRGIGIASPPTGCSMSWSGCAPGRPVACHGSRRSC